MESELGLSCCSIYSCPVQYEMNTRKILQSIKECKKLNCHVRVGGELELCGVNCKDSFKEIEDLNTNCWHCLTEILNEQYEGEYIMDNILCFINMPISFGLNLYSCVLAIYNREILFISPKEHISKEQKHYFVSGTKYIQKKKEKTEQKNETNQINQTIQTIQTIQTNQTKYNDECNVGCNDGMENSEKLKTYQIEFLSDEMEKFLLPEIVQKATNQKNTYFGKAFIRTNEKVVAHFFLDDIITTEYVSVQKGTWGDNHELQWDGKREQLINTETYNKILEGNKSQNCIDDNIITEEDISKRNIKFFEKNYIHMKINEDINFEEIDILLISGYVQNEIQLFKKYFIELMNLSTQFSHLIISFNNNIGCDNNFYMFDGFSFVAQGGKVLTKNARFSFSEIQVASVGVVLSKQKKETHQHELKQTKRHMYNTNNKVSIFQMRKNIMNSIEKEKEIEKDEEEEENEDQPKEEENKNENKNGEHQKQQIQRTKCIFTFNEDLPIFIKNESDIMKQHLPENFNWMCYAQHNPVLYQFFKSYHETDKNVYYEFKEKQVRLHNSYEEICFNCSLFLWHILHLTKSKGFVLAISGGVDSTFVACMVYLLSIMLEIRLHNCVLDEHTGTWKNIAKTEIEYNYDSNRNETNIHSEKTKLKENEKFNTHSTYNLLETNISSFIKLDDQIFLNKVSSLLIEEKHRKHICNKLLNTISLPSQNSTEKTQECAEKLSKAINSYHVTFPIDKLFEFYKQMGENFLNKKLQFKSEGGSTYEDICLQNIQSRNRMLLTYFLSTLICHKKYMKYNLQNEFLLTLATGNLDESVLGYYTKYDCSSGDINILGNLSKLTIKEILCQIGNDPFYDLQILNTINFCPPSAELKPLTNKQTDETDLQLKYTEIKLLSILKNSFHLGPLSIYHYLSNYLWSHISPQLIIQKVHIFFNRIYKNTHKLFILPPSISNESCGLNDSAYIHYGMFNFQKWEKKLHHNIQNINEFNQ